jgi:hypothetical protein
MLVGVLLAVCVFAGVLCVSTPPADAGIILARVAPARRVAARVVSPPYPVARRAVVGPVYRPLAYPAYRPVIYGGGYGGYGGAAVYAPGVSVWAY